MAVVVAINVFMVILTAIHRGTRVLFLSKIPKEIIVSLDQSSIVQVLVTGFFSVCRRETIHRFLSV